MITASLCAIGDELLIGQVKDTNSSFIAKALNSIGVQVNSINLIGDNMADITRTLDQSLKSNNILIFTGGLGPTKDDRTKDILFKYTGARSYVKSDEQETIVRRICENRKMAYEGLNCNQPMIPDTAQVIVNKLGTAPGMWFEMPASGVYGHHTRVVVSLPGVPFETEALVPKVCEKIQEFFSLSPIVHKTIGTFGIPESTLAQMIADWEDHLPESLHLAYLPGPLTGVRLRLSAYGTDSEQRVAHAFDTIRERLGTAVYGEGSDTIPSVVANLLLSRGACLASAESCTGGYIAHLMTSMPGASQYFLGSVVSYHNQIKEQVLGVDPQIIESQGAVSEECVKQMALGVQQRFAATYAIATSGIAGPDGGSALKPVGTVWVAVAGPSGVSAKAFHFNGNRGILIERFSAAALDMLRLEILADKNRFLL